MKAILNLYIYSSLHIAFCAAALCISSYFLISTDVDLNYVVFVAAGTMLLYSLHRIIGIKKVSSKNVQNRFKLIRKYRNHLIFYASAAAIVSAYTYFQFPTTLKIQLIIPSILSLLYVLPLFVKNQRLRDFNYVKIFLVAVCWAWLCGTIPVQEMGLSTMEISLFTLEKFLFIFAITLPFDLRDYEVDKVSGVKTLAHLFRENISYAGIVAFLLCAAIAIFNTMYTAEQKITLVLTYLVLEMITRFASRRKHDYYFSGVIDGTMILFYLGMIAGSYLQNNVIFPLIYSPFA